MKVLVVEDDVDVAEPLLALLDAEGFDTGFAGDASEALPLAERFKPDLALVDIGLPRTDGWQLGRLLREIPGLSDLPIIALTGNGTPEDFRRSLDAHFQHHLVKPTDYARLLEIIRAHEALLANWTQHRAG